jgi:hypothetical protein
MNETDPTTCAAQPTAERTRGWLEVACWFTLAYASLLYWIDGPAVSTDQLAARTLLCVIAALGGAGFRTYALLHRH